MRDNELLRWLARRAARARANSIRSQYLAFANGSATIFSALIAVWFDAKLGGDVTAYVAGGMAMTVLLPLCNIVALEVCKRRGRTRGRSSELINLEERIEEDYEVEASTIDQARLPEEKKSELRLLRLNKYLERRDQLLYGQRPLDPTPPDHPPGVTDDSGGRGAPVSDVKALRK
jgi:hypothetical protein